MVDDNAGAAAPAVRKCPICARPADQTYKPFCSKRCADVDLAKWLGGRYAIPASEDSDEDGDAPQARGEDDRLG